MANWYDDPKYAQTGGGQGGAWYDDPKYSTTPAAPKREPASSPKEEDIGPLKSGVLGTTADIMTAGAKVADVFNWPEYSQSMMEGAESRRKTVAERYHPEVPSYEDIYKPDDVWGTVKRAGTYAKEKFLESAPQMAGLAAVGTAAALAAPEVAGVSLLGMGSRALAGLGAAAAADVIPFTGSNLKAQMETGKSLPETSLGTAFGAAIPQSILDVALGEVLPGVGKPVFGKMLSRAAKKALEGGLIEGTSEGLQQAIEIGQADPEKLWRMDSATQKEILEAAIAGGLLGGAVGGGSGALQSRRTTPAPDAPPGLLGLPAPSPDNRPPRLQDALAGEEARRAAVDDAPSGGTMEPPRVVTPDNVYDMSVPYPRYGGTNPPPQLALPPPSSYRPTIDPRDSSSPQAPDVIGLPDQFDPTKSQSFRKIDLPIPYQDTASEQAGQAADQALSPTPGTIPDPRIPAPPRVAPPQTGPMSEAAQTQMAVGGQSTPMQLAAQAKEALPQVASVVPTMAARRSGERIEEDFRKQAIAAGETPAVAGAGAKIVRALYERLGTVGQADPWAVYQRANLSIQQGGGGRRGGLTFNQDDTPQGGIFSELTRQVRDIGASETGMKKGTGQQWLNLLEKRGLKAELDWSILGDELSIGKDKTFTREQIAALHKPYALDVYENKPDPTRDSYAAYTLGAEGGNPRANYREVVLSESPSLLGRGALTDLNGGPPEPGGFQSGHFKSVPNPVAHYRTVDRSTPTGDKVMLVEEIQSDWHQAGRDKGYTRKSAMEIAKAHLRAIDLQEEFHRLLYAGDKEAAEALRPAWMQAIDDYHRMENGVPDAPFKQTWPNMVFKYALMDAIKAGKDYVAWTTGEQQAERYRVADEDEHARRLHGMQTFYDKRVVDIANKIGKHYGTKVESLALPGAPKVFGEDYDWMTLDGGITINPYHGAGVDLDGGTTEQILERIATRFGRALADHIGNELANGVQAGSFGGVRTPTTDTVHAMKITPAMRETLGKSGMSLAFNQNERANITFLSDQTVIRLFKNADASSLMHEVAHLIYEEMRLYAPSNKVLAADLHEIDQWLGVEPGKRPTKAQHEKLARGWERYLQDGKAPTAGLKAVFKKFAEWLNKIYTRGKELDAVPANIAKVFDRMLGGEASSPKAVEQGVNFDPGPMPAMDSETFSQSALERMHRNASPQQLKGLASQSPDKAARFIVHKDGSMTAGAASQFTHDQLMYPDGNGPVDARQIEHDWYSNVAARGFVHQLDDGRFVHDVSSPQVIQPPGGFSHPITQRLERAGILDPSTVQSHHSIANVPAREGELTFDQGPLRNPLSVSNIAQRAVAFTKTLYADTKAGRLMDPLGKLIGKTEYLKLRNALARANTWMGRDLGAKALAEYNKANLSEAQQEQVMKFLETANADPALVPFAVRARAVADKKWLIDHAQHLVDLGVLPKEIFEKNKGAYVPRLYLKYLLDNRGLTGAGLKPNANPLKPRDPNKTLEERAALGEIRHPGVVMDIAITRMMRDEGAFSLLNEIAGDGRWSLGRSMTKWKGKTVTPEWLLNESEAMAGPRAKALEGMGQTDKATAMRQEAMQMYQHAVDAKAALKAAEDALPEGEKFSDRWKKLPDTINYGRLRGAWVAKDIANDITGMADFVNEHSFLGRWLGDKQSNAVKFTQYWKMMKVPFNPGSQVRNGVSNLIAAQVFAGVPMRKMIPLVVRAVKEMHSGGPGWEAAKRQGIPAGTMAENELYLLTDMLKKGLANVGSGPTGLLRVASIFSNWGSRVGAKASDFYGATESAFKTAIMIHAMESKANGGFGMSEADAAILANEALFDYSLVHPSIRYARNAPLGSPFITYTYKMLPQLGKTLLNNPLRFLPYAALTYALPAMVASMWDLEDGDIEKMRMALAEGLRRQNNMFLLPTKNAAGDWHFIDIGYFFPWQVPQDMAQGAIKGSASEATKPLTDMAFSNPIINAIVAMKTNIDPFTKRKIVDERDPLKEQAISLMGYIASQMLPTALSNYGVAGKLYEKETGTGMNRYGEPTLDYLEIGARMAGINMYPIRPDAQRARNLTHMNSEIQQEKSRLTYSLKDQSLTPEQKQRMSERYIEKIKDMTKEMQKYGQESAMTPSLARASARP